jgi:hypothetical protein
MLFVFVLLFSSGLNGAKIQFDISPATTTFNVEILNPPGVKTDVQPTSPVSPTEVQTNTKSTMPDFIETISRELVHIFTNPTSSDSSQSRPNSNLTQVLNPPFSENKLPGKGEKELVAVRDGEVKVELLLSTYNQAQMEVRLIDTDGSEVWFNGSSLLIWNRPDGSSFAPVFFKGKSDESSMVLRAAGDYSPKENISYSIAIKEGQKLILRTTGNPNPRSYIRASGSAF